MQMQRPDPPYFSRVLTFPIKSIYVLGTNISFVSGGTRAKGSGPIRLITVAALTISFDLGGHWGRFYHSARIGNQNSRDSIHNAIYCK